MLVGIFCMFSCFFLAFPETNLNNLSEYFFERDRDRLGRKSISVVYVLFSF